MEKPETPKPKETMTAKKPYRTPELRFERVFEVMALVCGKISHTEQSCHSSRKVS